MKKYQYKIIAEILEKKISDKLWIGGEKLPSIQKLVEQYQVSKNTVIHALRELEASGLIEARPKTGNFVTNLFEQKSPISLSSETLAPKAVNLSGLFNDIMQRGAAFDILPHGSNTPPSNHIKTLNRYLSKAQRSHSQQKVMQYDSPLGSVDLRFQIKEHYRSVGLNISAADYCITNGCQNSLFLALMATCQSGDNVAIESPAFYGVLQLLDQLQLNVIEISSSPIDGIDPHALENAVQKWKIKACVVTPSFATPSGANMPNANKKRLVELANRFDIALIEDDIYGDLHFTERAPPLKAFDSQNRVILCSSFSKSLSRDLRLGWIAGGRWHDKINRIKLVTQLASSQSIQQGMYTFMAEGYYRRHLNLYRQTLKRQRDQLIICLQKYWPSSIRFSIPSGGLAIWVQIDEQLDTSQFYYLALNQGIVLTPGALFSASGYYKNCLRLSFAHPTVGHRENAIRKLADLLWA